MHGHGHRQTNRHSPKTTFLISGDPKIDFSNKTQSKFVARSIHTVVYNNKLKTRLQNLKIGKVYQYFKK